jgi:predicted GIY-YIG superfamily endonuclease
MTIGTIYLLHFDRPYKHARHYTGWTIDLTQRLSEHRKGHGARLITVITVAGIGFELARIRPGTRSDERAIKRFGGATRYCPLCTPRPRRGKWGNTDTPTLVTTTDGTGRTGSRP